MEEMSYMSSKSWFHSVITIALLLAHYEINIWYDIIEEFWCFVSVVGIKFIASKWFHPIVLDELNNRLPHLSYTSHLTHNYITIHIIKLVYQPYTVLAFFAFHTYKYIKQSESSFFQPQLQSNNWSQIKPFLNSSYAA